MMQLDIEGISRHVAKGAHNVLLLDRAGWHTTAKLVMPRNTTPILLLSRSPELNPVENIWQYPRHIRFGVFLDALDHGVDHPGRRQQGVALQGE